MIILSLRDKNGIFLVSKATIVGKTDDIAQFMVTNNSIFFLFPAISCIAYIVAQNAWILGLHSLITFPLCLCYVIFVK